MMTALLALLLMPPAAPARASEPFVEARVAAGGGAIFAGRAESGFSFSQDKYQVSARVKTARYGAAAAGSRREYSAALKRELYHVSVAARLGTSPPDNQRAAYHLAGGEVWMTFYGLRVGPSRPELSPVVWESTETAPAPESFDRTWVSRFGFVYTSINDHLEGSGTRAAFVENVWQGRLSTAFRERLGLDMELGGDRYNRAIASGDRRIVKDNIDYPGNAVPLLGWPNNWLGGRLWAKTGRLTLAAAGTRLNMLGNGLVGLYGADAAVDAGRGWALRAGYERLRYRGLVTRAAFWAGVTKRW